MLENITENKRKLITSKIKNYESSNRLLKLYHTESLDVLSEIFVDTPTNASFCKVYFRMMEFMNYLNAGMGVIELTEDSLLNELKLKKSFDEACMSMNKHIGNGYYQDETLRTGTPSEPSALTVEVKSSPNIYFYDNQNENTNASELLTDNQKNLIGIYEDKVIKDLRRTLYNNKYIDNFSYMNGIKSSNMLDAVIDMSKRYTKVMTDFSKVNTEPIAKQAIGEIANLIVKKSSLPSKDEFVAKINEIINLSSMGINLDILFGLVGTILGFIVSLFKNFASEDYIYNQVFNALYGNSTFMNLLSGYIDDFIKRNYTFDVYQLFYMEFDGDAGVDTKYGGKNRIYASELKVDSLTENFPKEVQDIWFLDLEILYMIQIKDPSDSYWKPTYSWGAIDGYNFSGAIDYSKVHYSMFCNVQWPDKEYTLYSNKSSNTLETRDIVTEPILYMDFDGSGDKTHTFYETLKGSTITFKKQQNGKYRIDSYNLSEAFKESRKADLASSKWTNRWIGKNDPTLSEREYVRQVMIPTAKQIDWKYDVKYVNMDAVNEIFNLEVTPGIVTKYASNIETLRKNGVQEMMIYYYLEIINMFDKYVSRIDELLALINNRIGAKKLVPINYSDIVTITNNIKTKINTIITNLGKDSPILKTQMTSRFKNLRTNAYPVAPNADPLTEPDRTLIPDLLKNINYSYVGNAGTLVYEVNKLVALINNQVRISQIYSAVDELVAIPSGRWYKIQDTLMKGKIDIYGDYKNLFKSYRALLDNKDDDEIVLNTPDMYVVIPNNTKTAEVSVPSAQPVWSGIDIADYYTLYKSNRLSVIPNFSMEFKNNVIKIETVKTYIYIDKNILNYVEGTTIKENKRFSFTDYKVEKTSKGIRIKNPSNLPIFETYTNSDGELVINPVTLSFDNDLKFKLVTKETQYYTYSDGEWVVTKAVETSCEYKNRTTLPIYVSDYNKDDAYYKYRYLEELRHNDYTVDSVFRDIDYELFSNNFYIITSTPEIRHAVYINNYMMPYETYNVGGGTVIGIADLYNPERDSNGNIIYDQYNNPQQKYNYDTETYIPFIDSDTGNAVSFNNKNSVINYIVSKMQKNPYVLQIDNPFYKILYKKSNNVYYAKALRGSTKEFVSVNKADIIESESNLKEFEDFYSSIRLYPFYDVKEAYLNGFLATKTNADGKSYTDYYLYDTVKNASNNITEFLKADEPYYIIKSMTNSGYKALKITSMGDLIDSKIELYPASTFNKMNSNIDEWTYNNKEKIYPYYVIKANYIQDGIKGYLADKYVSTSMCNSCGQWLGQDVRIDLSYGCTSTCGVFYSTSIINRNNSNLDAFNYVAPIKQAKTYPFYEVLEIRKDKVLVNEMKESISICGCVTGTVKSTTEVSYNILTNNNSNITEYLKNSAGVQYRIIKIVYNGYVATKINLDGVRETNFYSKNVINDSNSDLLEFVQKQKTYYVVESSRNSLYQAHKVTYNGKSASAVYESKVINKANSNIDEFLANMKLKLPNPRYEIQKIDCDGFIVNTIRNGVQSISFIKNSDNIINANNSNIVKFLNNSKTWQLDVKAIQDTDLNIERQYKIKYIQSPLNVTFYHRRLEKPASKLYSTYLEGAFYFNTKDWRKGGKYIPSKYVASDAYGTYLKYGPINESDYSDTDNLLVQAERFQNKEAIELKAVVDAVFEKKELLTYKILEQMKIDNTNIVQESSKYLYSIFDIDKRIIDKASFDGDPNRKNYRNVDDSLKSITNVFYYFIQKYISNYFKNNRIYFEEVVKIRKDELTTEELDYNSKNIMNEIVKKPGTTYLDNYVNRDSYYLYKVMGVAENKVTYDFEPFNKYGNYWDSTASYIEQNVNLISKAFNNFYGVDVGSIRSFPYYYLLSYVIREDSPGYNAIRYNSTISTEVVWIESTYLNSYNSNINNFSSKNRYISKESDYLTHFISGTSVETDEVTGESNIVIDYDYDGNGIITGNDTAYVNKAGIRTTGPLWELNSKYYDEGELPEEPTEPEYPYYDILRKYDTFAIAVKNTKGDDGNITKTVEEVPFDLLNTNNSNIGDFLPKETEPYYDILSIDGDTAIVEETYLDGTKNTNTVPRSSLFDTNSNLKQFLSAKAVFYFVIDRINNEYVLEVKKLYERGDVSFSISSKYMLNDKNSNLRQFISNL